MWINKNNYRLAENRQTEIINRQTEIKVEFRTYRQTGNRQTGERQTGGSTVYICLSPFKYRMVVSLCHCSDRSDALLQDRKISECSGMFHPLLFS